ncbi:MAG: heavy metal-associated domain-containing protein [Nanoarchaeota archaeon]
MKTTITIKGMHCKSCKMLIEDACSEIAGVKSCTVDFNTGKAVIEHDGKLDLKKVKKEIEGLGEYKVTEGK